jgi:hypothetical protein
MADETEKKVNGAPSPIVIALRKSVVANGDEVMSLSFREPTAGDIEVCGNPVNIDVFAGETPKVTFDAKAMTAMLARLALVPPSTIRNMHPRDWNTAAWNIASFFMPEL